MLIFANPQGTNLAGSELRIVPLGSSSRLTVRQRGTEIYSVFFLGGSSSVLAVLTTILMSGQVLMLKPMGSLGSLGNRLELQLTCYRMIELSMGSFLNSDKEMSPPPEQW